MKNFINRALVAKKHLKLFFALFAMLAINVGNAWGADVTYVFKDAADNPGNANDWLTADIDSYTSWSATKGGSNNPKYYSTGTGLRVYNGGKFTITSSKTLASITLTFSGTGYTFQSNNTTNPQTVTPNAKSYEWSVSRTCRLQKIEITYAADAGGSGETAYSVTLNQPANGAISAEGLTDGKAAEGVVVKLTATPDAGYKWESWTVTGASGNVTVSNNQFTMPAEDVTVSATFVEKEQYAITWSVNGELKTLSPSSVAEGEAIGTLPEAEDCPEGKVFVGWTAVSEHNDPINPPAYIDENIIPEQSTTYYAVFATKETTTTVASEDYELKDIAEIQPNDVVVVTMSKDGTTWALTSANGSSSSPTAVSVTISGNKLANAPDNALQWNISKDNSSLVLYPNGTTAKWLYCTSSNSGVRVGTNTNKTFTLDPTSGYLKHTGTSRYLGVYNGQDWRCYTNTTGNTAGQTLGFYVKSTGGATIDNYTDFSLDCSAAAEPYLSIDDVTDNKIDFGSLFVENTLEKEFSINAAHLEGDIALTLSGDDCFTVSTPLIAKDADFPQTVIVTYAPTAAGTHSAELTITSSELSETITLTGQAETPTIYTLTDLADIKAKDQVIIVGTTSDGTTYAMSNDKGTGSAPAAVAVTISDDKLKTNNATIVWNLVKDGDNLTFYPNGTTETWLYCTNSNNGVRVGINDDNKVFTLDATSGYLKNTATSRYVGVYNNQDWRCYTNTTGNTANQSFAFYVLPNTDPSIDVNPESQDFVVALNGSASQEVEITAHNIAAPAYSTSISGDTYFTATVNAGKVTVTYAPTVVGEHAATLTITETTSSQTATVALTGKCVEAVDVATAMATDDNTIVALKPFEVVKVISAKNYVYIKDATGASLIYDYNDAHSMGSLVEGATVNGFVGKKGAYNKNPQLTPSVDYSALSVSGSGTAVATEITEVKAEDVNEFVVLKGVEITSNVNINTHPTLSVNDKDVAFRNQFERNFEFQSGMLYDIYGFVGVYNETVQFWFLEAAEAGSTIEYYTVTYEKGASDVIGNVPVDTKEYAEGETVTLKPCELTREGYTFNGWNVTSTNGTVAVTNNQFIMPGADVTATALWEEVKTYDQGAWVLVTDASELAVDDDVIIAAANENYTLGTTQNNNNRGRGTIIKGSNVALLESDVQILTLENGKQSGTLALSTGNGYLYAASSSSNYLRTETSLSDNSSWTIAINEGLATIEAQGTNTHNLLQYNSNSEIFSCYSSKQAPVAIYEYKPNERVITFDVQGGEAYAHTYVATTDGILIVPTEVPTHAAEGQLFDSWNDKQDGSGNTYNAGDIFSFSEHTVLYAQWAVADAYHVTYNIAGASGTTPVDANHYYGGEIVTLASQGDLVNPGHIFAGWKVVDANNTEILVTENTFIMPQSDVTATAKWVRQTNDKWVLVTEDAQLVVGEKYVIACNTQGAVAGNINTSGSNPYMNKLDAAFSDDKQLIKALAPEAIVLTLGGTTDAWTFTNESGKALGATAAKKMAWDSGTTTWLLTFDANGALTMKNATAENGSLKYNSQSPRFTTYASGQTGIQLYILNPAQVVEGDKTDNDVPQYSNVTVEDGGDLSVENTDTQYGDMYINNGGSVEVDENAQLTVNNLYIQTTMGTTTSGQLNTAPENLIVNGDAFIDITLGKNGDPSQWHAFTVPFPVDAMNGVYDLNDKKLTNGVNYAIMQYHGDVRAQGKYGWKKYSGTLVPGTFYLMTVDGERTTYRFKKVKDADLVAANTKSLSAYTGDGKTTDYGWNGVGNPTLMHGKVAYDAQILDPESYTYKTITASSAHFTVGTPFFIQAAADATVTIAAEVSGSLAPARRAAAAVDKVKVMLGNADYTDYLYVSASEDATNEYEIGKDLAKMTMTNTPIVPQIFAHAYGTYLCMVNAPMISNEATVALNLYAPAEGEYTLSVEEQADATVYLLYNGNIVWNLSMGEYPIHLTQGNNAGYSLVVRRENAPTDVENIFGADEQTEKFIYNGNLYILHEGKVFDAVGNVLK